MRNAIFISYSHADKPWLERFDKALRIGVTSELYSTWSDQDIGAGEEWERKIEANIASARVALLLVTPEFLQSTYIGTKELPAIVDRNQRKGLVLQWVPIKFVAGEKLKLVSLDGIQSLWPIDRPLADLPEDECQKAIEVISGKLIKSLGLCADINTRAIEEWEGELKAALGKTVVLGERIGYGDGSLVYKATQEDEEIAVKVAMPSMRRAWVATDFVARANGFRKILDPLFIRIRNAGSDAHINWVTMDHVDLPSLKDVMTQSGTAGLPPPVVTKVLAKVTLAASNLHQESMGRDNGLGPLLVGPLRPNHIYRNPDNGKIKISPIQMSQATLQTSQARPLAVLAEDELTWLAPEQYDGQRVQVATDQYYIGLLGLELLTGAPPVMVNCFADLNKKRAFFAAPMAEFAKHREASPALFFVLARMLERRPEDRWPTMADAHRALGQIAEGSLPDELRSKARDTYRKLRGSNFYGDVYEGMFRICDETRKIFEARNINMEEQQKKLHEAAGVLLNFRPTDDPHPMSRHATSHHALGLQPEHFTAFRDAFLSALLKQKPKPDSYAVDAWRAILDAGIAYMTTPDKRNDKAAGRRRRRAGREGSIRLVRSG
jgi:hemoglobin-like flavoprotein